MRNWILVFCLLLLGCKHGDLNSVILAQLTANVTPVGDTKGENSAYAVINFTRFQNPPRTDKNLQLTFTNPEGDILEIVLAPLSDVSAQAGFPVGQYNIDASKNTFTTKFTVAAGSPSEKTITASGTGGFVILSVLNFGLDTTTQTAVVTDVAGSFHVNFDVGGAGEGTMSVANAQALQ